MTAAVLPAHAHPVPFSYVSLHVGADAIDGTVVVHIYDAAHDLGVARPATLLRADVADKQTAAFVDRIGRRLRVEADGKPLELQWGRLQPVVVRASVRIAVHAHLTGRPGALDVAGPLITYEPEHQTFLQVYEGEPVTQSILDRDHTRFEYFSGSRQGTLAVIRRFVPAGIHHILIGPDHLLFLAGLLLLGGTRRRLLTIITAFTLAHSITLSLAALSIVTLSPRIVEPAIALSIICVGAENLRVREGRDLRPWLAFLFGFIHGFGFASVLREMDLPRAALGWSLFSFNAGVEIGQLLVVVPVAAAFALVRSRGAVAAHRLVHAGSWIVIAAGAFWFVQRILGTV